MKPRNHKMENHQILLGDYVAAATVVTAAATDATAVVRGDHYKNIKSLSYYYEKMTSGLADEHFKEECCYVIRPSGTHPGSFVATYYTQEAVITGPNAPVKCNAPIKHVTLYYREGVGLSDDKSFPDGNVHTCAHDALVARLKKPLKPGVPPAPYADKLRPYCGPVFAWLSLPASATVASATVASATAVSATAATAATAATVVYAPVVPPTSSVFEFRRQESMVQNFRISPCGKRLLTEDFECFCNICRSA